MSDNSSEFLMWLEAEIERRGWTRAEFSRKAGVSQSMVSLVLRDLRHPGDDFCKGVALAFGGDTTPETVMRRAGLLPSLPLPEDDTIRRVVELMRYLPNSERREVLEYVQFRANKLQVPGTNG